MWSISYSHMLQQFGSHDLSVITMKQDSSYTGGHCILTPLVYHSYFWVWKRRHSLPPVFNHFQTGDGEGLTMRVEEWALLWMQTDSKQQGEAWTRYDWTAHTSFVQLSHTCSTFPTGNKCHWSVRSDRPEWRANIWNYIQGIFERITDYTPKRLCHEEGEFQHTWQWIPECLQEPSVERGEQSGNGGREGGMEERRKGRRNGGKEGGMELQYILTLVITV